MRSFKNYLKIRETSANDVGMGAIGDTSLSSQEEESMSKLFNIVKMSWSRYKSDTKQFLEKMGIKDPEIKRLVDELESNTSSLGSATKKTDDMLGQPSADQDSGIDDFK